MKNRHTITTATALALCCLAISQSAQATCQEGCLANANTVVGDFALLNSTGSNNTALGFVALIRNTTGGGNTASGVGALEFNTIGNANTVTGSDALNNNTIGNEDTANGGGGAFFQHSRQLQHG